MRQVLIAAVNESYEDQLKSIRCPVRMIWGAEDTEVPVSVAERAARILAGRGTEATVTAVDGAGHLLPVSHPASLREVIVEVLAR
jgi:pimeloyl-ACP methyl ester carboxylesterase